MSSQDNSAITTLHEILNYVRVDGPLSAPITVLTIEDGRSPQENDLEKIKKHLKSMVHEREEHPISKFVSQYIKTDSREVQKSEIGNIGLSLCKIAVRLLTDTPEDPEKYMKFLYSKFSLFVNVKFFPLTKPNMSVKTWEEKYFDGALPLQIYQYLARASSASRHRLLLEEQIRAGSIPIVAGALEHWAPLLFEVYMNAEPDKREYFDKVEDMTKSADPAAFRIYRAESGKAMFYECKMIRTQIGDDTAKSLAKCLAKETSVKQFLSELN